MRTQNINPITPQRKIIGVQNSFGNENIKFQQGTTRVIYDSIPIDGRSEYRFFEEANTRLFPFTNMSSEGNRLGVGSALAVERFYLSIVTVTDGEITDIQPLTTAFPGIMMGELSIEIANSQVVKQVPILSTIPNFNKSAQHTLDQNFEFDTQVIISPLFEFVFKLRVATTAADATKYLRLTVEGAGSLLAPKQTM